MPEWLIYALQLASVVGGVIGVIGSAVMFWMRHSMVSRASFERYREDHDRIHEAIDGRLDRGDGKFSSIDGEIKHRPGFSQIEDLRRTTAALTTEVRVLNANHESIDGRLGRMESQVEKILDFHLHGGK